MKSNYFIARRMPRKAQYGFTLVEVLVAISIFAIIAGAIFAVFSKALDVWENARIKTNFREESLIVLDGMEKELKNCITPYGSTFHIEPQKIFFTTLGVEIYNVLYVFNKAKKGLYRYKVPFPTPADLAKPLLILKNVQALNFVAEYPEVEEGEDLETEVIKFPKTIKINLTVSNENQQNEYELQRVIDIPVSE